MHIKRVNDAKIVAFYSVYVSSLVMIGSILIDIRTFKGVPPKMYQKDSSYFFFEIPLFNLKKINHSNIYMLTFLELAIIQACTPFRKI